MPDHEESGIQLHALLNLRTRWRLGVKFTTRKLYFQPDSLERPWIRVSVSLRALLGALVKRCKFLPSRESNMSIILQCVDKTTRCSTSYEWSLLSTIWLCMFRTITSPSSGASSHKLYDALQASLTVAWIYIHAKARLA